MLSEVRVRTRVPDGVLGGLAGRIPTDADYDVLLTGGCRVVKPDGKPLAVFLPGVMREFASDDEVYGVIRELSLSSSTQNRGLASGTPRITHGTQRRSYTQSIYSVVAGAVDAMSIYKFCRLTAWTGENLPKWQRLQPCFDRVAEQMREQVPDRFKAQMDHAARTQPEWVIPGTPFTTVTVNNTYSTGVHTDKGDLGEGFSSIWCLRRGSYTGGRLMFPQFRVAADLADGDLILMDAHEWHGNTAIRCECGETLNKGPCRGCGAERITVVTYFRAKLTQCGTPEEELGKARQRRELQVDEPAAGG